MREDTLHSLLQHGLEHIPGALMGICVDLDSPNLLASAQSREHDFDPAQLGAATAQLFSPGDTAGLERLRNFSAVHGDGDEEVILFAENRCFVFLRSHRVRDYAIAFLASSVDNVGLTIARTKIVRNRLNEVFEEIQAWQ